MVAIQTRTQRILPYNSALVGVVRAPHMPTSPQHTLEAIVAAAFGILLVGASLAPGAQARTSCSYQGAPANVLNVVVRDEAAADAIASAEIKRKGQAITVNEFQERPQPCAGGTPTVLTTDTINVLLLGLSSADLRLGGGPFAPGATPETVGASEIEIRIKGESAQASVVGTSRADEFHWGPGGATPGLNLNPGSAGDRDVDVTVEDFDSFLVAEGGAGNDMIIGQPGARIPDGAFSKGGRGNDVLRAPRSGAILQGGPGNDAIAGAGGYDMIEGGVGNDRVTGGGGPDEITGGPGNDRLFGGAGRDLIKSRDSARDTVRCGRGRDRATADRRDRVRGCERISGR